MGGLLLSHPTLWISALREIKGMWPSRIGKAQTLTWVQSMTFSKLAQMSLIRASFLQQRKTFWNLVIGQPALRPSECCKMDPFDLIRSKLKPTWSQAARCSESLICKGLSSQILSYHLPSFSGTKKISQTLRENDSDHSQVLDYDLGKFLLRLYFIFYLSVWDPFFSYQDICLFFCTWVVIPTFREEKKKSLYFYPNYGIKWCPCYVRDVCFW